MIGTLSPHDNMNAEPEIFPHPQRRIVDSDLTGLDAPDDVQQDFADLTYGETMKGDPKNLGLTFDPNRDAAPAIIGPFPPDYQHTPRQGVRIVRREFVSALVLADPAQYEAILAETRQAIMAGMPQSGIPHQAVGQELRKTA